MKSQTVIGDDRRDGFMRATIVHRDIYHHHASKTIKARFFFFFLINTKVFSIDLFRVVLSLRYYSSVVVFNSKRKVFIYGPP